MRTFHHFPQSEGGEHTGDPLCVCDPTVKEVTTKSGRKGKVVVHNKLTKKNTVVKRGAKK